MTGYHAQVTAAKREILRIALLDADGNRTEAARRLGLQRTHFCRLIRAHGLGETIPRSRRLAFADA